MDNKNLDELSPFELKDRLIKLASSDADRLMLNAGRGNPNFLATLPRRAFLRISDFAIEEAERSYSYLDSGLGGLPDKAGMLDRFDTFSRVHDDEEGISFLTKALAYVNDQLGIEREDLVHEMVMAALGSVYPNPPRMLTCAEQIVSAYVRQEMFGTVSSSGPFSLFATEGGTAAMTYIFQTLTLNHLIKQGDKIALGTPIFSPYLEIPPLPNYDLELVEVRMDEEKDWQFSERELAKLEDPDIKILCLVNPSNPPSTKLATMNLDQIANLVATKRPDLYIVTDDVYGTFADDFVSVFARCPRNTLCVYSFSKYFGSTGWRLGVIAAHEDNVFDEALANLPEAAKKDLDQRYSSLSTDPRSVRFIDRLVADSRTVALNHTAGDSTPQQLMMTLFALLGLMDRDHSYKDSAKGLIRKRYQTLCTNLGIDPVRTSNDVDYYTLIDLQNIGEKLYGADFSKWFLDQKKGFDFLFRLARETGVVLLPGKGFDVVHTSARVSLANLKEADYARIGQFSRQVLAEYFADYQAASGTQAT